jgi:predicted metalloprotease
LTGQAIDLGPMEEPTDNGPSPTATARSQKAVDPGQETLKDFVSVVLASTEDVWEQLLSSRAEGYVEPKLVLFSDAVDSACGFGQSAVGPFYCARDAKVYLDLSFFRSLERLDAPGDFAQAYVIAHEVGHHVQNLMGTFDKVAELRQRTAGTSANSLSVLMELQADCFAGVWAHHANARSRMLEPGDVEEGFAAAAAVGDDRLQQRAQGRAVPESFTHGSSRQRASWLRRGLERGTLQACDTFGEAGISLDRN